MSLAHYPWPVSDSESQQLTAYLSMLVKWNRQMNLAGINDPERIRDELIADSFYLAHFMESLFKDFPEEFSIWDLGAGAGLPGIPLRILWPKGKYVMVEARQKRALFLQNVIAMLRLPGIRVYPGRVERFFLEEKRTECILSRAFMPPLALQKLCSPHVNYGGRLILLTNKPLEAIENGWEHEKEQEYHVNSHIRFLTSLKKTVE